MVRPHCPPLIAAVMWIASGPQIGTARADDTQVNTYTGSIQQSASVALGADGDFVVVWHSFDPSGSDTGVSIQGQRYASDGSTIGGEFQVNTYTTNNQFHPTVAMDTDGDFVVVWRSNASGGTDSDDSSIHGQRYASDGSTVGVEFQVNTYTTSSQVIPSVAMEADGDFVVVWESLGSGGMDSDGRSIQGQLYASDGSPAGGEFQVNTYTTKHQSFPSVVLDADGDFVVVWDTLDGTDSIQGQRYAADGSRVGFEFQVNTYTTSRQRFPSVALAADGDFVVVWQSDGSGGSDTANYSIQGQLYASNGSTVRGEFQVNTYTTSNQLSPSVARAPHGDFVVVWRSSGSGGSDSSGASIQGQRYAADGSTIGGEFQVNTYTTSSQSYPSVALAADGDFVVVWDSLASDGTDSSSYSIQKSDVFCLNDAACDDGLFCNGTETCDAVAACQPGTDDPCDDGVSCTADDCNETTDSCVNVPVDSLCDNGLFCDGTETCDPVFDCQAGDDPCPFEACDEVCDDCLPVVFADGFESGDTSRW